MALISRWTVSVGTDPVVLDGAEGWVLGALGAEERSAVVGEAWNYELVKKNTKQPFKV